MGMFTSVIDAAGREYQFKCGWDDCDTYRVGDKVDQKVYPDSLYAGKLLDGAYLAEHCRWENGRSVDHDEKWAVIAKGVLVALDPVERDADGAIRDGEDTQSWVVALRHGAVETPLSSWTDAAYLKWAKQKAESARRQLAWDVEDYGLSVREKGEAAHRRFFRAKMREDGFSRRILPPIPADPPTPIVGEGPTLVVEGSP